MEGSRLSAFSVTPLTFDHAALLHKWLQEPHVMKFWDDGDRLLEDVINHYHSRSGVKSWIASFNETPFAYLQIYFVTEHHELSFWRSKKYTTIGLDFFIGEPSFLEKGLAIPLLVCFIDQMLLDYLPFRLLVDPDVNNAKAARIYDKMGFEPLGEFQNNGESYRILKKDVSSRSVQIVPYDPKWPKMFEEEASRIKEALGENCLAVHHFGSTSVPGLSAKPKIDILAVVKSFAALNIPRLVEIGYEVRNDPIPTGKYFVRELPRMNLHVFEEGNTLIAKNLTFRD